MRIALPLSNGQFCRHFGRMDGVALFDVDGQGRITQSLTRSRPSSGCESLPRWLASLEVRRVLVGGIGGGAVQRLSEHRIEIAAAQATGDDPEALVREHLADGRLLAPEPCHAHHDHHDHDDHHCRAHD